MFSNSPSEITMPFQPNRKYQTVSLMLLYFSLICIILSIAFRLYGVMNLAFQREYFIRDPEAFKIIAIKGFDHFEDRRGFFNEEVEDLWGKSLFSMHGADWRQMRATLSPAFTGSKMRQMFELITECSEGIVKHFQKRVENGEKIDVEMKDVFSRYTNDVIATCAFGIKINSFDDPDNSFYLNGKELMDFGSVKRGIRFFIGFVLPTFARIFDIRFFDKTISNIFKSIILDTMDVRQKNNIYRPDMINILMQVREGTFHAQIDDKTKESADGFAAVEESSVGKATVNRTWSENEIIAQCLLFFLAGFETSSSVLMFAAYELVANPDVQQKLYEEIEETNKQLDGKRITYDVLQKMKYLDQVISETLRMWPVAVQIDRKCVKDYIYDDGKLHFKIDKGSSISFSLYGVQHDPKYFPEPDSFNPDRFSDENKSNIVPGTYVPFGVGPRNCIGKRKDLLCI